jgi:hypothetical protein
VGTNAPLAKFQVGDGTATTEIRIDADGGSGAGGFVRGYRDTTNAAWYIGDLNPIAGGTNDGMCAFTYGANPFIVFTNGVERLRVDSAGNLGLGTSSPTSASGYTALTINNATNGGQLRLENNGSLAYSMAVDAGNVYIAAESTRPMRFFNNNAETMRLTSDGNLGVGTTSPANLLHINGSNSIARFSGASTSLSAYQTFFNNSAAQAYFGIESSSGTGIIGTGAAYGMVLTTASTNPLVFGTNNTERARILAGGEFAIGKTLASESVSTGSGFGFSSPSGDPFFSVVNVLDGGANGCIYLNRRNTQATNLLISFLTNDGTNQSGVGSITHNGTNTAYNTSSDRRLKENIAPADDAGKLIDSIQIVKHDWKAGGHTRYGAIAQDLYAVAPEAVAVGDADDVEEFKNPWGVDYSKLVPMLVKEIQSLRKRVAELEAK